MNKIYIKDPYLKGTFKEFIASCFSCYMKDYDQYDEFIDIIDNLTNEKNLTYRDIINKFSDEADDELFCRETYHDENCTREQCHMGARRSFLDLYALCKTYYPRVRKYELVKFLCDNYLYILCGDIDKIVFWQYKDTDGVYNLQQLEKNLNGKDFVTSDEFNVSDLRKLYDYKSKKELVTS